MLLARLYGASSGTADKVPDIILQKLPKGWDQTGAPYVNWPIPIPRTRIDFKLTQSIAVIFDSEELIDELTYELRALTAK